MSLTHTELLDRYDAMQRISLHMLDAAKNGDWDRLIKLEQSRAGFEKDLRQEDKGAWDDKRAARKAELIRGILDADNETRRLAQRWMNEMQISLNSISAGKKMTQAYQQG